MNDIEDGKDAEIIWKVKDGIFPSHRYRLHVTAVNQFGNSATVTADDISTPGMLVVLWVDIRHHRVLLIRVPEQITEDQRMVTNVLLYNLKSGNYNIYTI